MNQQRNDDNDLSFADVSSFFVKIFAILRKYKLRIFSISILLSILFGAYAWLRPKVYISKTIFIVEESKANNGLGNLGSLVGQLGVDILNNSGGNIISGDNIFVYLKSESLTKSVLKSKWDSSKTFFEAYLQYHGYWDTWMKNDQIKQIDFNFSETNSVKKRLQDSLLQLVTERILKSNIFIEKLDKKTGFINYQVKMNNEKLSKTFSDRLLDLAVKDYISLKTDKQLKTVKSLQDRADSLFNILNKKTVSAAQLQIESSVMDINPINKSSFIVNSETNNRDKMMLVAMYSEVVKNLELAKFTLGQQTPVFQVIDESEFPLKVEKPSILKYVLISFVFSVFLQLILLYLKSILIK